MTDVSPLCTDLFAECKTQFMEFVRGGHVISLMKSVHQKAIVLSAETTLCSSVLWGVFVMCLHQSSMYWHPENKSSISFSLIF